VKRKIYHLLVYSLLAGCSIPLPITPTPHFATPPAARSASTELFQVTITPASESIEPAASSTYPLITKENVKKLVEIKSTPMENASLLNWLPGINILAVKSRDKIILLNGNDLSTVQEKIFPEDSSLLDFNAETRLLAFTTNRINIDIRDLDGKVKQTISPPGGFGSASFSPDGKQIWLSSMEEFKAIAYDVGTAQEITSCGGFETAAPIYSTFPSPGGKWLVWIARATIQLNLLSGCKAAAHIGHEDFIISHAFSSDESILVTSTAGTINGEFQPLIYFWNAQTGEQINTISIKESPAMGLAYSPDDSLLVSAGSGLFVWDAKSGSEMKMLAPVDQHFSSVILSPDGQFLAAATEMEIHLYAIQP
jgi:WD40 repeat protein